MQTRAAVASQVVAGENGSREAKTGCFEKPKQVGNSWGNSWGSKNRYFVEHDKNKEEKEMLMLMLVLPWLAMTMFYKHSQLLTTMFFWLDADSGGWGDTFASSLRYFSLLFSHTDFH